MWDFEQFEEKIALKDEYGKEVTYIQLKNMTKQLAGVIGKRTLVFCLCENKIGSVVGYSACINENIVSVLLNAHLERELLRNLIEIYQPEFVWAPAEMQTEFKAYHNVYEIDDYALLKTGYELEYNLYPELALLLTTSGSTGSPKFVRQSYTNIKANTDSIVQYLNLDCTEKAITTLPMNYTYGLSIINTHLMVGATILLTDKSLMQKEFWNFFKEEGATSFGGVPYTYEMLDKLRFYRMNLPSLRYMTQAGGKIIPELHKKFAEYACQNEKKFVVMYGQCEATARMGYLPADKALEKCGSMGIVIPGGKFNLIDADGNDIKGPNITGELVYEGANVTLGYAECMKDLSKGDERGGILQTGDMAQKDEDGFFYIVGRKKRFLKIYGNRVNLDEIDRLIKAKYSDCECASAGVDDHMYIFVTNESKADEIRNFIIEKTKLNPKAFKAIVIDEIPKNDAGKILYKELAKYYDT
ncbi:MAG: AMP-dependent synthetase [Lachnospiraceae bacterium]|nr:AMP-dependent synthetase [Lachnospiraceae bacterium]